MLRGAGRGLKHLVGRGKTKTEMRGTISQTQEPLQDFWVFGPQQYNRAYQIYSACIHSRQEESNISSDEPMRLGRNGWSGLSG
jgi:hypothetical protein